MLVHAAGRAVAVEAEVLLSAAGTASASGIASASGTASAERPVAGTAELAEVPAAGRPPAETVATGHSGHSGGYLRSELAGILLRLDVAQR